MNNAKTAAQMADETIINYEHFENFLRSLENGGELPENTKKFFDSHDVSKTNNLFDRLIEISDSPTLRFARVGWWVLLYSIEDGEFSLDSFNEITDRFQKYLVPPLIEMMYLKAPEDDDYFLHKMMIDDMRGFVENGERDIQSIITRFLIPTRLYLRGAKEDLPSTGKLVYIEDHK